MNITYEKNGDYLIPNLISDPEPEGELRKFGLMRRHYLKEHRSSIYQAMLLSGKLKGHLFMMQEQAETQFDLLVKQMGEQEGVIEHLKEKNQMLWVQRMNNIRESGGDCESNVITMMITHYNRRLILSNQLSVGYIPICMQILDLSRRNWQMGGKNTWKI